MKIYLPKIFEQFSVLHQSERNKGMTRWKDIDIWRRRERGETIARETIAKERERDKKRERLSENHWKKKTKMVLSTINRALVSMVILAQTSTSVRLKGQLLPAFKNIHQLQ